jgi:hypothetical protein
MSKTKHPLFKENSTWIYDCTEPSCLDETSPAFWWLKEREPWLRISQEIVAGVTVSTVLASAEAALRVRMALERTSEGGEHARPDIERAAEKRRPVGIMR